VPLDDLKWAAPDVEVDTPLDRRRRLIQALRDYPQPWDFRYRATCAMGLAVRLGIASFADHNVVGPAIGISAEKDGGSLWPLGIGRIGLGLCVFFCAARPAYRGNAAHGRGSTRTDQRVGMQKGRGGMGSRKHGISGRSGKGPATRLYLDMMARRDLHVPIPTEVARDSGMISPGIPI
jgi:hypothetical protein